MYHSAEYYDTFKSTNHIITLGIFTLQHYAQVCYTSLSIQHPSTHVHPHSLLRKLVHNFVAKNI